MVFPGGRCDLILHRKSNVIWNYMNILNRWAVTKDVAPNTMVGGVPAKFIKHIPQE